MKIDSLQRRYDNMLPPGCNFGEGEDEEDEEDEIPDPREDEDDEEDEDNEEDSDGVEELDFEGGGKIWNQ